MKRQAYKIDLHNYSHFDAERYLEKEIESLWNSDTDVDIITGNSKGMKEVAHKVLSEYKLPYSIGDWFGVNKGFLQVIV